ncbi:cell adhesion molecule DSCAML1-like isoform X2 [Carettochelys insculpta]
MFPTTSAGLLRWRIVSEGWRSYRMMGLTLLLVFPLAVETAEAQEQRTVPAGSSVLLNVLPTGTPPVIDHLQWEYIANSNPENVVDYYKTEKALVIYAPFQDRVIFNESTGSLLLKNVQETDSGIYRATVNLNKVDAREVRLQVLEPVPEPQLQINSTAVGSSVELSCKVPAGHVQAIDWKKDGKPLPSNKCYQLSKDFTVLYIPEAQKSDCGSFSCNVSNDISWQETYVHLTLDGIMPPLSHALKISTVVLALTITLAAGSGFGLIILCCQTESKEIKGELWRWLVVVIQGLVCISSILMLIAAVFWMWEEGLSTALTLCMILLMWVIIVTLLIFVVLAFCPQNLKKFKGKTVHRVLLDAAAPGGLIFVVLFALYLTQNIHHLQRKGCSPHFDYTAVILIAAAVSLIILLALFVW